MKRFILALVACVPFAAVADDYHPVSWFKDHPAERKEQLHWCQDNSGLAMQTANCANAADADWDVGMDAMKKAADEALQKMEIDGCRKMISRHGKMSQQQIADCVAVGVQQ